MMITGDAATSGAGVCILDAEDPTSDAGGFPCGI